MQRALQIAEFGCKDAYPNPMVGAVIVYDEKIIGEGWHEKYGHAHAEVNAINNVDDPKLLNKSTIYVTLEPCSHHGKTPPCSDLIIEKGIKRVVIGCIDTFSAVSGRGVEKLKNAGIEVEVGVLEKEARELNKRFFTFHEKKRPFIVLKWAESEDGFIDKIRTSSKPQINWITGKETKTFVHSLRRKEQGILVGWRTIKHDNPSLTVRNIEGTSPIRFVIDPNCKCPKESKVFQDGEPTFVFCKADNYAFSTSSMRKIEIASFTLPEILKVIYQMEVLSVFVEGGAYTIQQFIDHEWWDEAYQLVGTSLFNAGTKAPKINSKYKNDTQELGQDLIQTYKNK
jgi:diaminohydroxyphosphoribosylaminopyrimidine deaminase/5-amino-6-(5-phosphoribosylamino)uracil reductase